MALDVGRVNLRMRKGIKGTAMSMGAFIKRKAQRLTPVDTGFLRTSAIHRMQSETPFKVVVDIIFEADYAEYVHDITYYHHDTGQALFLFEAVHGSKYELRKIMEKALQK